MKKLLVILIMAFVMCVPELSFAQSQKPVDEALRSRLAAIESELMQAIDKLAPIIDDDYPPIVKKSDPKMFAMAGYQDLRTVLFVYMSTDIVLRWYPCVTRECSPPPPHGVIKLLRWARTELDRTVKSLQYLCGVIETPAAVVQLAKAKDIIRSTLPLYDKAIQILEAKQEKK
jgi:hypothetical protein